ncbi:FAD-binding protein [Candidatus Saccharibacteria bacterium]|nr:FAD-binding protein [Candidatus Saccharibacteria bacterium]
MIIKENVPISTLTTMRLGGPARFVIEIEKPEEIPEAYTFANERGLPVFVLSGGANTIGHDEGYPGVIIINRMKGIAWAGDAAGGTPSARRRQPSTMGEAAAAGPAQIITVMGGEIWDDVVAYACERNLTGIEALSKIPGLAAAAPVQNIGAYGQEVADTLVSVEAYDTQDKSFKTLTKDDLKFSYRQSILNTTEKNRYFIISLTLKLTSGQMLHPFYNSIERYIAEHHCTDFSPQGIREIVSTIRADKLPDPAKIASAGSFFKNIYLNENEAKQAEAKGCPVYHGHDGHKINSGWLIEEAGFKGKLLHGIRVNEKAALVLINESATGYNDLAKARQEITDTVYEKFGYKLEQEPVEIQ